MSSTAAPDMLAALEIAFEALKDCEYGPGGSDGVYDTVQAALAKAKGDDA